MAVIDNVAEWVRVDSNADAELVSFKENSQEIVRGNVERERAAAGSVMSGEREWPPIGAGGERACVGARYEVMQERTSRRKQRALTAVYITCPQNDKRTPAFFFPSSSIVKCEQPWQTSSLFSPPLVASRRSP